MSKSYNLKELNWNWFPLRRDFFNDVKIKPILSKYKEQGLGTLVALYSLFWENRNRVKKNTIYKRFKQLNFNYNIGIDIVSNYDLFKMTNNYYYSLKIEQMLNKDGLSDVIKCNIESLTTYHNSIKKRLNSGLRSSNFSSRIHNIINQNVLNEKQIKNLIWVKYYNDLSIKIDKIITVSNVNDYANIMNEFKLNLYNDFRKKSRSEQVKIEKIYSKLENESVFELINYIG